MDVKDASVLIVATCGRETPDGCTAPFFFAQKAAAMGANVDICFILHSALLLKRGVAESTYAKEGERPVSDFIAKALEAGVEFHVCDAALKMNDMSSLSFKCIRPFHYIHSNKRAKFFCPCSNRHRLTASSLGGF